MRKWIAALLLTCLPVQALAPDVPPEIPIPVADQIGAAAWSTESSPTGGSPMPGGWAA